MKYHIEKNSVQETLVIPLFGRLVCSEHFPHLFKDPEAERICASLDYDFSGKRKKMESPAGLFGALEVAQRQYDLCCEVKDYLKDHPKAAVVNLGCGLDDTFRKCDNGSCRGYNIDFPDVIQIRNELLPAGEREANIACDLNDPSWMEGIDAADGAVFFAAGVFYYFKTEDAAKLFDAMAGRFPGAVLVFDTCNERGAKLMRKTWLKEAGISDVKAYFSLEDETALYGMSRHFASVTAKSYMRGYRDIYNDVSPFHKLMIRFCDTLVKMKIIRITFGENDLTRKEQIRSAYKLTGSHAGFYDGMMTYSTLAGKAVCRLVWNMDGEKNLRYIEQALSGIPEDFCGKLLEVPVGTSVLTMPVYKELPSADITCLDYSADMMAAAKQKADAAGIRNITFRQGDVGALPFEDGSFDIVLSMNGFHAFPDKEAAWCETFRVLKPGGTFCGCFYIEGGCRRTDRIIKTLYVRKGFFTPPFETAESLKKRLESMYEDVRVTAVEGIGCFRCRKKG